VGVEDEVVVSVFADFCRARLSPVRKSRSIRALALEDLQELLRGQWSDVSEYPYDNPTREETPLEIVGGSASASGSGSASSSASAIIPPDKT
jgi:hypothetical protein